MAKNATNILLHSTITTKAERRVASAALRFHIYTILKKMNQLFTNLHEYPRHVAIDKPMVAYQTLL